MSMNLGPQPARPQQSATSVVSQAVTVALARQDVPIASVDVPATSPKVTAGVMAAIAASPDVSLVPVQSAFLSKVNWTQVIMLLLTLITWAGVPIDDATKLQIVSGVVAIGTILTIAWKTWFTKSIAPQSK